jgi:hypothetical protein
MRDLEAKVKEEGLKDLSQLVSMQRAGLFKVPVDLHPIAIHRVFVLVRMIFPASLYIREAICEDYGIEERFLVNAWVANFPVMFVDTSYWRFLDYLTQGEAWLTERILAQALYTSEIVRTLDYASQALPTVHLLKKYRVVPDILGVLECLSDRCNNVDSMASILLGDTIVPNRVHRRQGQHRGYLLFPRELYNLGVRLKDFKFVN